MTTPEGSADGGTESGSVTDFRTSSAEIFAAELEKHGIRRTVGGYMGWTPAVTQPDEPPAAIEGDTPPGADGGVQGVVPDGYRGSLKDFRHASEDEVRAELHRLGYR